MVHQMFQLTINHNQIQHLAQVQISNVHSTHADPNIMHKFHQQQFKWTEANTMYVLLECHEIWPIRHYNNVEHDVSKQPYAIHMML
jgi:hypothetical protein